MTKIAISGAAGRMGRRIAALAIQDEKFDIVEALETPGHPDVGRDIGELAGQGTFGVRVTDQPTGGADVLIDFSLPEGTMALLGACRSNGTAMVIGTTGLTASQEAEIADTASTIPIVHSHNMSMGINVLLKVVADIARALGEEYDVEIQETHHRFKADAPSGTAIMLAKGVCDATGRDYGESAVLGRGGKCPRSKGEIGMHAIRLGDTVGEHSVHFGTLGETVTVSHGAHTRDTFALGALRAARWLADNAPGLYDMRDVLGLR